MKKIVLILFFFISFFASAQSDAACNLSKFTFGSSMQDIEKKLKAMGADKLHPTSAFISTEDRYSLGLFGGEVCKRDKAFKGAQIEMVFLYNKLVELHLYKFIEFGDSPELVDWAENIYGAKDFKPPSFYASEPNAFWVWDGPDSTVFYNLESIAYGVNEEISIQTDQYQDLYKKYSKVQDSI